MKNELIGDYGQSNICYRTGKIKLTKREAGEQLNAMKGHRTSSHIGRGTNKPKRAYYCEYCGAYHVTHLAQAKGGGHYHSKPLKATFGKGYDEDEMDFDLNNLNI